MFYATYISKIAQHQTEMLILPSTETAELTLL